jgi:hypothetical protein
VVELSRMLSPSVFRRCTRFFFPPRSESVLVVVYHSHSLRQSNAADILSDLLSRVVSGIGRLNLRRGPFEKAGFTSFFLPAHSSSFRLLSHSYTYTPTPSQAPLECVHAPPPYSSLPAPGSSH